MGLLQRRYVKGKTESRWILQETMAFFLMEIALTVRLWVTARCWRNIWLVMLEVCNNFQSWWRVFEYLMTGCDSWDWGEFPNRIRTQGDRLHHWIEDLRKTLKIVQNCPAWNSQRWLGQEAAVKTWTTMTDFILQFNVDKEAVKFRPLIVQQAYRCLNLTQVQQLFSDTFGAQAGFKLWSKLNFITRPLVDRRLLGLISAREPQFRNCKISLVPSKSKTTLDAKYVVGTLKAWERLGLGSTPEHVVWILDPFSQRFEKACAETFSLHAEMQLVLHYEEGCAPQPTLDYFGCSKRTCLRCETFLGALPSPIATRGRHDVCYPAWAVPGSNSDTIEVAVERLEKTLLARIRGLLNDLMHPRQKSPRCECHAIRYGVGFFALYSRRTAAERAERAAV